MTTRETKAKEGLPREAFAIMGDPNDPESWKLPHHKRSIYRALKGKLDIEKTVDWGRMPAAVAALSPSGFRVQRVIASPEELLKAARHLANHYRKANRALPDTLAALG
jgi:ribosomal protein L32E